MKKLSFEEMKKVKGGATCAFYNLCRLPKGGHCHSTLCYSAGNTGPYGGGGGGGGEDNYGPPYIPPGG